MEGQRMDKFAFLVTLLVVCLEVMSCGGTKKGDEVQWKVYSTWPFSAEEAKRRQQETAEALGVPVKREVALGGGAALKLVLIPAGEFMMGSEHAGEPVHKVRISEPFYMSTTEVTQAQYVAVMGEKPWSGQDYAGRSEDAAANYVTWYNAEEFCEKLSEKTGHEVRLPTEAQWEYACRAGSEAAYCFGDSEARLVEYGWYENNAEHPGECYPHAVAQKKPNAWGLYDIHGNVSEWCRDWYEYQSYSVSPQEDPQGPSTGEDRVWRGGSWGDNAWVCRSANRNWAYPTGTYYYYGFRVVVLLSPGP